MPNRTALTFTQSLFSSVVAIVILSATHFVQSGIAADFGFGKHDWIKNAQIPVFLSPNQGPAAVITIDKLSVDFQRKGFFKIGVLSYLACDGVDIRVYDSEEICRAIADLLQHVSENSGRQILVRNLSVYLGDSTNPVLRAEKVRITKSGRCELASVSYRQNDGTPEVIPTAWLDKESQSEAFIVSNAEQGVPPVDLRSLLKLKENVE